MNEPRYSLSECCHLLGVDTKTLRRWLQRDQIVPQLSHADERVRYLTGEQLELLAQRHERVVSSSASKNVGHQAPEVVESLATIEARWQSRLDGSAATWAQQQDLLHTHVKHLELENSRQHQDLWVTLGRLLQQVEALGTQVHNLEQALQQERAARQQLAQVPARALGTSQTLQGEHGAHGSRPDPLALPLKAWLRTGFPSPERPRSPRQQQRRRDTNPESDLADRLLADERLPESASLADYLALLERYHYSNDDRWRLEHQLWTRFQRDRQS